LEIRQFKLATDDENICEVVEYHEEDDAIVIRKTMKLVMMDNMANGVRYYAFRPFMMYQLEPDSFQVVNCQHIVAEAAPSQDIIHEYFKALENSLIDDDTSEENMDEIRRETKRQWDAYQKTKVQTMKEYFSSDSSNENIIRFTPPKDKMH
jgi:hypothetical protein